MTALFEPLGEVSRREMVVGAISEREDGDTVPYEDLESLLGVNRSTVQSVVNQAKMELEKFHNMAVVAVRNVGYRIVRANEHLTLAQDHQRRSFRQLKRGKSKVVHVDFSKLTDGERTAITLAATSISLQLDYMRRNDIRASRLERAVKKVQTTQQRSDAEIAELRERLARLEGTTD